MSNLPTYEFRLRVWPDKAMTDRIEEHWPQIGSHNLLRNAFPNPQYVTVELVKRPEPPKVTRENMENQTWVYVTSVGTVYNLDELSMNHLRNIVRTIDRPAEAHQDNSWLNGSPLHAALCDELWERILTWND